MFTCARHCSKHFILSTKYKLISQLCELDTIISSLEMNLLSVLTPCVSFTSLLVWFKFWICRTLTWSPKWKPYKWLDQRSVFPPLFTYATQSPVSNQLHDFLVCFFYVSLCNAKQIYACVPVCPFFSRQWWLRMHFIFRSFHSLVSDRNHSISARRDCPFFLQSHSPPSCGCTM